MIVHSGLPKSTNRPKKQSKSKTRNMYGLRAVHPPRPKYASTPNSSPNARGCYDEMMKRFIESHVALILLQVVWVDRVRKAVIFWFGVYRRNLRL